MWQNMRKDLQQSKIFENKSCVPTDKLWLYMGYVLQNPRGDEILTSLSRSDEKKTGLLARSTHASQPISWGAWRFLLALAREQITYFQVLWPTIYLVTKSPLQVCPSFGPPPQVSRQLTLLSNSGSCYWFLVLLGCQQSFQRFILKNTKDIVLYVS